MQRDRYSKDISTGSGTSGPENILIEDEWVSKAAIYEQPKTGAPLRTIITYD